MERLQQKRIVFGLAILISIATLVLAVTYTLPALRSRQAASQAPVRLRAVPVAALSLPKPVSLSGTIQNATSVPVNAPFSGGVLELYVHEGQTVQAGQALCKLEPAKDQPASPPAGASQQAQSAYDRALAEVQRNQKLFEIGAIPRKQLEASTARLQQAKDSLAGGTAVYVASGPATVTAPVSGIITGLSVSPDKPVQAGQQVCTLGSGQAVEVVVRLDQNTLYLAELGTAVVVEAGQQSIAGQISRIYPQAEANQSPYFLAYIKLSGNPSGSLTPGTTATVRLDSTDLTPVQAVPAAAVLKDKQGRKYVYVAVNGKAVLQPVEIGVTRGELTEVTTPLPAGSLIITTNLSELHDGDAITVVSETE